MVGVAVRRFRRGVGGPVAAAGVAVVLASGVTACGSSSTNASGGSTTKVSATAYATSLCDAVGPFEKSVASSGAALDDVTGLSPDKGKVKLVSFLGALSTDSGQAVQKLKAAGVPEVSGGAEFSSSILKTFVRLQGTLGRSQKVAQQLSTSSESTFQAGAKELSAAVKESIGDIAKGLDRQSNKALDAAAAKVAACHSL